MCSIIHLFLFSVNPLFYLAVTVKQRGHDWGEHRLTDENNGRTPLGEGAESNVKKSAGINPADSSTFNG